MNTTMFDRRMADNEAVFRRRNEQMQQGFEQLKQFAHEDNQANTLQHIDVALHFYCECSDENCRQRILILPSQYDQIHKQRDQFILKPGHEVDTIERVIVANKDFSVVQKFEAPDEHTKRLQPTPVDNV